MSHLVDIDGQAVGVPHDRKIFSPDDVPESPVRAYGAWVAVIVEPAVEKHGMLYIAKGEYDQHMEIGIGWVLSADKEYLDLPPRLKGKTKTPRYEDKNFVYQMPVKRGDRIFFRRFLRSQGLMQADVYKDKTFLQREYPGHEVFFLHAGDVLGFVEDEAQDAPAAVSGPGEGHEGGPEVPSV